MAIVNKKCGIEYYDRMHRIGYWITWAAIAIFVAVPLILSFVHGIYPSFSDLVLACGGIVVIFLPTGVAEMFAEVPVMGSSYYVSCVTGNILNLKLPAAMNALKLADVKSGTEVADAITGVAVAVSSMVTLVMLAITCVLLTPLQPLFSSPAVTVAAGNVLPALFGCLAISNIGNDMGAGIYSKGRILGAVLPFVLCVIAFLIDPDFYNSWQGVVMMICIPLIYIPTKIMYKKGIIKVFLPEDRKEGTTEKK